MSVEAVKEYFDKFGRKDDIMEFEESSATVELAAIAVGTKPERIAKTLSYKLKDDLIILVVAAGDARVENKLYKGRFSCKAKMLTPEEAIERVGHAVGGVCPFGIKDDVKVYLDESMKRFETVFPACGSSNSAIELDMEEMEKYSQNFSGWVSICSYPGKEEA